MRYMSSDKKLKEKRIVNLIYHDNEYLITDSEEPDFILVHIRGNYSFGVEVTEYYLNQSNARIRNISNAVAERIKLGDCKHNSDKNELRVENIKIASAAKRGKKGAQEVLTIQLPPDVEKYVEGLIGRIIDKNEKLKHYNLSPINLILLDTENFFSHTISRDEVYTQLFNAELKRQIINSGFREIYLITEVDKGKQIYIPLKMIYFLTELNLLMHFIDGNYPELRKLSAKEFLMIGLQYFISQGIKGLGYAETDGNYQIAYSNYVVSLSPDKGFYLKDYFERDLPHEYQTVHTTSYESVIDEEFRSGFEMYTATNTLYFKIGYAVNKCEG